MKRYALFLLAACVLFSAVACNIIAQEDLEQQEQDLEAVNSSYEFLASAAAESLSPEEISNVAKINDFAFKMALQISKITDNKSYVYSPISISYVLGMLSEGAAGDTRAEICNVLGFGSGGQQAVNEFSRDLMVIVQKAANGEEVLEFANAAIANKRMNFYESYKQSLRNYYDADLFSMDFDRDDVVSFVNDWAARKTHGRIDHVLDNINPLCMAIFMNAVYFKASWADPFYESGTKDGTFTTQSGEQRTEKMMKKTDYLSYYKGDKYEILSLPYGYQKEEFHVAPSNYSMSLILPSEGVSVDEVIGHFNSDSWTSALKARSSVLVNLWLPRFNVKFDEQLEESLKALGMRKAFVFEEADFSAMSKEELYINTIKQVANISVDEKGTEAAAVTVALLDMDSGEEQPKPMPFHCNRPFIFAITEQTTGAILFLGCYR